MTKIQKIIAIIVAVAILSAIYIVFGQKPIKQTIVNTNQIIATSTNSNAIINSTDDYKIEQVPINEGQGVPQPIPDLSRAVTSYGSVKISPNAIIVATGKIKELQAILQKNPADFSSWLNLGIYQKMGGDYEGATLSWQYASKLASTDYISLGNLGNIYAYFIKDNIKAEMYYKKAIQNGSTQKYLYIQFAEVYRDLFHDNLKALDVINQGLSKIPNDADLLQIKTSIRQ